MNEDVLNSLAACFDHMVNDLVSNHYYKKNSGKSCDIVIKCPEIISWIVRFEG